MAELIIKAAEPGSISFNFDELKTELTEKAAIYETMVFSEDQFQEAKKTRSDLNRVAKALSDERIKRKKQFMEPFEQFEKQIKEHGDKVPADVKAQLDSKLAALKDAIAADDTDGMKAKMKDLEETAMKMGEAVYAAQQQAQQQGAGAPPPPNAGAASSEAKNDDGVVDAEVVE